MSMMTNEVEAQAFLARAEENLASATSELANDRYNACANRCYYSCFQAAIVALMRAGIRPAGGAGWGHAFVQAQFAGQLVNRRKLYPADLRDVLPRLATLRERADYRPRMVNQVEASRAVRRAQEFVEAVRV